MDFDRRKTANRISFQLEGEIKCLKYLHYSVSSVVEFTPGCYAAPSHKEKASGDADNETLSLAQG